MTALRSLCAVLLACLSAPAWVGAQVLRCEDANGKVTYTNTGCPCSQAVKEVLPTLGAEELAQQNTQYQQALQRKHEEQIQRAERDAAQRAAEAERAVAQAAQRPQAPPPLTVQEPPLVEPYPVPVYGPWYPPRHPPVLRPRPPLQRPDPQAPGYNCNVFKCYDGKGNTWSRP